MPNKLPEVSLIEVERVHVEALEGGAVRLTMPPQFARLVAAGLLKVSTESALKERVRQGCVDLAKAIALRTTDG